MKCQEGAATCPKRSGKPGPDPALHLATSATCTPTRPGAFSSTPRPRIHPERSSKGQEHWGGRRQEQGDLRVDANTLTSHAWTAHNCQRVDTTKPMKG